MKSFFSLFLLIILFIGCGYKPSSHYAKNAISGDVYVDLIVDIENAQNSIYVKDAMNEMILNQFKANLTNNKELADTFVLLQLASVRHIAMSTDDDGYAKSYRTTVSIEVSYNKRNEEKKRLSVTDYYDYSVDNDSIITDQKKQAAIKIAAAKALSNLFSKIAVNSMKE
ncbi:MAG: LPS assembly lipoprotein LptE [Arcobacteraceae bacterium]